MPPSVVLRGSKAMTLICNECGETSEDGEGWKAELAVKPLNEHEFDEQGRARSRSSARGAGRASSATRDRAAQTRLTGAVFFTDNAA
jgi:hypothetical protein